MSVIPMMSSLHMVFVVVMSGQVRDPVSDIIVIVIAWTASMSLNHNNLKWSHIATSTVTLPQPHDFHSHTTSTVTLSQSHPSAVSHNSSSSPCCTTMAPKSQSKRARVATSDAAPQFGTGMESLTVIVVLHSLGQSFDHHDVIFVSLSFISIFLQVTPRRSRPSP